jgi:hypothetical protein
VCRLDVVASLNQEIDSRPVNLCQVTEGTEMEAAGFFFNAVGLLTLTSLEVAYYSIDDVGHV